MFKQIRIATLVIFSVLCLAYTSLSQAQSVEDIRWKSPATVESILGTPISKVGPAGTVRRYQMWDYGTYVVAFTNDKVSHVFAWPPKYLSE